MKTDISLVYYIYYLYTIYSYIYILPNGVNVCRCNRRHKDMCSVGAYVLVNVYSSTSGCVTTAMSWSVVLPLFSLFQNSSQCCDCHEALKDITSPRGDFVYGLWSDIPIQPSHPHRPQHNHPPLLLARIVLFQEVDSTAPTFIERDVEAQCWGGESGGWGGSWKGGRRSEGSVE